MCCPVCGSTDLEANTWEAWCHTCDWQVESPSALYDQIRAYTLEARSKASEADVIHCLAVRH